MNVRARGWGEAGAASHWPGCPLGPAPEEGGGRRAEGRGLPCTERVCLRLFLREAGRVCAESRA